VPEEIFLSLKVGNRIKELREKRGITQEKLAEISGLDPKHIQLMESRKPKNAKIGTLENISGAFGLTLAEFFSSEVFLESKEKSKKSILLKARSNSIQSILKREKVLEDKLSFIIFQDKPVSKGHLLIFPKRVFKSFYDSYPEEKQSMLHMLDKGKKYLDKEFKPDGYNIGFDLGEVSGQFIPYFCIHIIPRYSGDSTHPFKTGIQRVIPEKLF
jgi:diadenosine tetraphosphate (Ap4A) HIT family hydrolase/DNA-binding XRE family transcriptional regulator